MQLSFKDLKSDNFVLCDANTKANDLSYLFVDLVGVVDISIQKNLETAFDKIQNASRDGLYIAGYVAYDFAALLDENMKVPTKNAPDIPLLKFGIFKRCIELSVDETNEFLGVSQNLKTYNLEKTSESVGFDRYMNDIATVKTHLVAGNTYQANYTYRQFFKFSGNVKTLYRALRGAQPVFYGSLIVFDGLSILSRSPELFFEKRGSAIKTRPMKGTAKRKSDPQDDIITAQALAKDEKNKAENMIIVDLLRNDLARICTTGSVKVEELMHVETYKSVHQMTSTIVGNLPERISLLEIFRGLFPCGSITGAPKIKTMEIIRETEKTARGIYTGAIGYVMPNGDMCFNVAIRTLVLPSAGNAIFGVGGGIVHDSNALEEFQECKIKTLFLDEVLTKNESKV